MPIDMINIFDIRSNDRYLYDNKVIIVNDVDRFNVSWYYLNEWIDNGQGKVNLHKSSRFELLFKARNIR